jgi:hypothetical protein
MGLVLLVTAVKGVAVALGYEHVPLVSLFTYSAGFFFGACLLFGSFNFKRLCKVTGGLTILSLMALDLAKWRAGLQSLGGVIVAWVVIGSVLAFAIFVLWRRSRKNTNAG